MTRVEEMPEYSRSREKLREKVAASSTYEKLFVAIIGHSLEDVDIVNMSRKVVG